MFVVCAFAMTGCAALPIASALRFGSCGWCISISVTVVLEGSKACFDSESLARLGLTLLSEAAWLTSDARLPPAAWVKKIHQGGGFAKAEKAFSGKQPYWLQRLMHYEGFHSIAALILTFEVSQSNASFPIVDVANSRNSPQDWSQHFILYSLDCYWAMWMQFYASKPWANTW